MHSHARVFCPLRRRDEEHLGYGYAEMPMLVASSITMRYAATSVRGLCLCFADGCLIPSGHDQPSRTHDPLHRQRQGEDDRGPGYAVSRLGAWHEGVHAFVHQERELELRRG